MTEQEKGFWHKTKEVGGNLWEGTKNVTEDVWEGTKNVTEDVWEGTKNMAGGIKNAFSRDDEDDLYDEEMFFSSNSPEDDIYEEFDIETKKATNASKHHTTRH